jgi:hypothetical protein
MIKVEHLEKDKEEELYNQYYNKSITEDDYIADNNQIVKFNSNRKNNKRAGSFVGINHNSNSNSNSAKSMSNRKLKK